MGGNSSSKPVPKPSSGEELPPRLRSPERSVKRRLSVTPPPSPKGPAISVAPGSTLQNSSESESTKRLSENDISLILKVLTEHANKWREIGIAIGFTPSEVKVIQSKPLLLANAPNSWLTEMLTQWVQWTPETHHGKYATLEDLVTALRSRVVGLAAVAEEMIRTFKREQCDITLEQSPQSCRRVATGNPQDQAERSEPPQASSEPIPPAPSASPYEHYAYYLRCYYTRVTKPTDKWPDIEIREYINLAVISCDTQGPRVKSEEFRRATIHGTIDDILEEKAPILFSDLFKPNVIEERSRGSKTLREYAIKRILMEGAPGIGKSTMSWEVCRKWGNGELFQEFSLVVMLRFRDPWVQKVKSLSDLFRYPSKPEKQDQIAEEVEQTQGKGLLLILDGFDEAPPSLREEDSIFFQLFQGLLLPNATVMMTSRPSASADLRKYCADKFSRRVEILGFGKKEINEYIESKFNNYDGEMQKEDFFKYLELYPHIYSMMYVPLNCAIVTHVYQSCKTESSIVPQTMTQLYTALVKTLLLRYLKEIPEYKDVEIEAFSDLPQPVLEKFDRICKLAYDGITSSKKVIIFSCLPKDFDSLGLMQSVPELYIDKGASITHNFLHLTIQEYLAAYHLSLLSDDMQVSFIEQFDCKYQHFIKPEVAIFLAGFSHSNVAAAALSIMLKEEGSDINMTFLSLRLLFELHNPQSVASVFQSKTVVFNNRLQFPFEYYVLGFCIGKFDCISRWKITFRDLKGRNLYNLFDYDFNYKNNIEKLDMLNRGINTHQNRSSKLPVLSISITTRCDNRIYELIGVMLTSPLLCIDHLNLHAGYVSLDTVGVKYVINGISRSTFLKELDISGSEFSLSNVTSLAAVLKVNTTLTKLNICQDSIDSSGVERLAKSLESNTGLRCLDLSGTCLYPICIKHQIVGEGYRRKCNRHVMQCPTAGRCNEYPFGTPSTNSISCVSALNTMLQRNKCLVHLSLSACSLRNRDATLLAEALKFDNSALKSLDLHLNGICEDGAAALAEALLTNSTLTTLNLGKNHAFDEGAIALAVALQHNTYLESLNLEENHIGVKGFVELATMLQVNPFLKNLDLRNNLNRSLTEEGAKSIIDFDSNRLCFSPQPGCDI